MSIYLFVPGEPKAMGRPRARAVAGKTSKSKTKVTGKPQYRAHIYNPKTADPWKNAVKAMAMQEGVQPIEGPLKVRLVFRHPIQDKKKQGKRKDTKPDADNLAKAVLDALNGIAYADDSQVARLIVDKYYSHPEQAGVLIQIQEAFNGL